MSTSNNPLAPGAALVASPALWTIFAATELPAAAAAITSRPLVALP